MPTITILEKPATRKVKVEIDLQQWEQLADVFGFYKPSFLKTLKQSLKESRKGLVYKIKSLRDLEKGLVFYTQYSIVGNIWKIHKPGQES